MLIYISMDIRQPSGMLPLVQKTLNDDLDLGMSTIFYSWPSNGSWALYASDEDRVQAGRNDFIAFINMICSVAGADLVNLLAHSMGARLVTSALDHMSASSPDPRPSVRQVVLAAPDIDVGTFGNELDAYRAPGAKNDNICFGVRSRVKLLRGYSC